MVAASPPAGSPGCEPAAFLTWESGVLAASTVLSIAGGQPEKPNERSLGQGAIYWSDMIPSSVEQAVRRARALGKASVRIPAASLFRDTRGDVDVERVDPTDWVVRYHGKEYEVATDEHGCMLAATLPKYGVTIERRLGFKPDQYPLWAPYAAPPDGAYRAEEVRVRAPQGHVLAGTYTIPTHGARPMPAAVLITGLSPHERNNGVPPWMPLRDLADALTRAGISVLRVDDRGVGQSTGKHEPSTTFDEASDVQTEVEWLRGQPGVSHSMLPDPNGLNSGWVLLPAFLTSPDLLDTLKRWAIAHLRP
jgi:hypothetical protein